MNLGIITGVPELKQINGPSQIVIDSRTENQNIIYFSTLPGTFSISSSGYKSDEKIGENLKIQNPSFFNSSMGYLSSSIKEGRVTIQEPNQSLLDEFILSDGDELVLISDGNFHLKSIAITPIGIKINLNGEAKELHAGNPSSSYLPMRITWYLHNRLILLTSLGILVFILFILYGSPKLKEKLKAARELWPF